MPTLNLVPIKGKEGSISKMNKKYKKYAFSWLNYFISYEDLKVAHHNCQAIAFMFNGGSCSRFFYTLDTKICMVLLHYWGW